MKIKIKTIDCKEIEFDVKETTTFLELKEMISKSERIPKEAITLIYKTGILNDEETIQSAEISDLIVMVLNNFKQQPNIIPTVQPYQKQQQQYGNNKKYNNLNQNDERSIQNLINMGFDREQCIQAYFASNKNENQAANLLLDGF